jgi:pimeloyl-ACP methyl ester carboxylesterase
LPLLAFCAALPAQSGTLRLADCRLESPAGAGSASARCGWYEVPENRDDPHGRQLRVHVAVIPALRLRAAGDPLFVLSGGPGQAASDFYLSISPALARIRRDRDIVLVDQRGTGRSNRLDCAFPDESEFEVVAPEHLKAQAQACLAALAADPRYYTTSVTVLDLDEVRAALGYEKVNLYGVSYGTRVAQHYIRRHPDRVRAAILDGAVPTDLALGPDAALEAQRALDALFGRCSRDTRCETTFPKLAGQFEALRTRLEKEPLHLQISDPVDSRPATTPFGAAQLSAAVRLLSYSDESASVLPLLIHEAHSLQRPQSLAAQYLMIKRSADTQIAYGMHFAVLCSEDAPRWPQQGVTDAMLQQTYMGTAFMAGVKAICEAWPRGPVDADFNSPLQSPVPTLILSGGNDPVTPQQYGERALRGFSKARHLVLADQGHGQLATGCMPRVLTRFIAVADPDNLDTRCLDSVASAPFMLSRSGPAP